MLQSITTSCQTLFMRKRVTSNWFGIGDVADLLDGPNAKNYARE